ncbi:MAG: DUF4465 domain-containing protein [Verrucomicrobiales bacterium]|nr:DUF4465 domain-containing protein [Verrucomicrobiales bacterium]
MRIPSLALALAISLPSWPALAALIHFDDLPLAPNSFSFPDDGNTVGGVSASLPWSSGGVTFDRIVDDEWSIWSGITWANGTDTTTPGFNNQFSAYPGAAASGSQFALGYETGSLHFDPGLYPLSLDLTNTTYTALDMLQGSGFSKKFGGTSGSDPDYLLLRLDAYDSSSSWIGQLDVYLADYRFTDDSLDYVLSTWETVDLTSFGNDISRIDFSFLGSDNGVFGLNTPAYFAMDNLLVAPEPSRLTLLAAAWIFLLTRRPSRA